MFRVHIYVSVIREKLISTRNLIINSPRKYIMSDDNSKDDSADNAEGTSGIVNDSVESIRKFFEGALGLSTENHGVQVLETVDIEGIVKHWKSGGFKNIVTMVGAGISTSAGIPDFRSPTVGLYNNLQKYKLPYPTAIFEIDYFLLKPKPFFALAKELYPGTFKPTPCHYFIRMLHERGLLLRHYTQNIDTLERIAGIPDEKLVEAHGTFHTNHCLGCKKPYSMEWMKEQIFKDIVPTCEECNSFVKPDIVFFGEDLPDKFYQLPDKDFEKCDLLIIMGTSLEVQPFASLVDRVNPNCVRLLINREAVGNKLTALRSYIFSEGLHFHTPGNKRDVCWLGDCDDGINFLAEELGLKDELNALIQREYANLDKQSSTENVDAAANI